MCLCFKVWGFAEFPIRLCGSLLCSSYSFSSYSSCSCSHMSSSGHKFRVNQAQPNITSVSHVRIMVFFVCLLVSVFDRKRNQTERPQKKQVYIKKPLNAFMLFMKEQRPTVRPAIRCQGSGAVNAFLGTVVRVLSFKCDLCLNTFNVWSQVDFHRSAFSPSSGNLWVGKSRRNTTRPLRRSDTTISSSTLAGPTRRTM